MLLTGRLQPFELIRQPKDVQQLVPAPVGDSRERATLEAVCDRDHGLDPKPDL